MKKIIFTLLTFSVLMLFSCATDTTQSNDDAAKSYNITNIKYNQEHTDDVLDIYRTDDSVKKAVMFIHGGAWITVPGLEKSLGRLGMVQFKDFWLNNGYHVVNIDYRLINLNIQFNPANQSSPKTVDNSPNDIDYEDMLDDIKSAVKYIKDNADKYNIDASKIVMYGYSAGAHLAELYSYKVTNSPIPVELCVGRAGPADFNNKDFRKCEILNTFTNAAVAAVAAYNLSDPSAISSLAIPMLKHFFNVPADASDDLLEDTMRCWIITNLLGIETDVTSDIDAIADAPENQDKIQGASPIYHVTSSSPRTILLHGEQDKLVPYIIAESLNAKLEEMNVTHKLITLPNADHSLIMTESELETFNSEVLAAIK